MSVQYPAVFSSETGSWQSIAGDLDSKLDKLVYINSLSASVSYYILVLSDANKLVETTRPSFIDIGIPTNSSVPFPIGTQIMVLQGGTGQFGLSPESGVTLHVTPGVYSRAQWSIATLIKKDTDTWVATGDLTA
jgi:hypothetical protein